MQASFDLETMAITPEATITNIGVQLFNEDELFDTFYYSIEWIWGEQKRTVSPTTLKWWMQQSDMARAEIINEEIPLDDALIKLTDFLSLAKVEEVWGNGATFDISILENAYRQYDFEIPWAFWEVRDLRTLAKMCHHIAAYKKIPLPTIEFVGTPHTALHDATHQAKLIQMYMKFLLQ